MKRVKNTTIVELGHDNSGRSFIASDFTEIDETIISRYNDNQLWDWFDDGSLQFDDGVTTYTNKYEGWARLFNGCFGVPFLSNPDRSNGFTSKNAQEAIEEARGQGSLRSKMHFLLNETSKPFREESNAAYTLHCTIPFQGTSILTPSSIKVLALITGTGGVGGSIRIFDRTNANTIAEKAGILNSTLTLIDLGSLSNLSSGFALWELQMLINPSSGKLQASYLEVNF